MKASNNLITTKLKKEFLYLRKSKKNEAYEFSGNVYFVGIIIGAIFFNLWGTGNLIKPLIALLWTALFLIAIVYVDRKSE